MSGDRVKSYRPGSGYESAAFQERWCERCKRDRAFLDWYYGREKVMAEGCTIIAASFGLDTNDSQYPRELQINDQGRAICTAFERIDP